MAINKMFNGLNMAKISRKKNLNFTEFLESEICNYSFSVVWTNGQSCSLNYLSGNRPPSTIWHPIISRPTTDNDGEISEQIGNFPQGISLNLSFGLQAIDAIPKLAILITNITKKTVLKWPAGDKYQTLARGEFLQNMITISLP